MRHGAVLCALLLCLAASPALAKFDPSYEWSTIETDHFFIHFHQGEEELGRQAAAVAEEVHARLVPRITWEPDGKTHLVFVDAGDYGMGMAQVVPYRNIVFLVTKFRGDLGYPVDWLRTAILHEYTHVLQLDMVAGFPGILQSVLGRFYFPNMFQPTWMVEGLAEYEMIEGDASGRFTFHDAIVRMAVLEDAFPLLPQLSTYAVDFWPGFSTPYVFGASFNRYLAERYGREKVAEISAAYSGRAVPFLVDSTGRRILDRSYDDLWKDWLASLRERYGPVREEVEKRGRSATVPLTRRGFMNVFPAFSPDGERIAYSAGDPHELPGIRVMARDGGEDGKLLDNSFQDGSVSWSRDGKRLYYSRMEVSRNTSLVNDLYCYDFARDEEVRMTEGLRARDPHPSPDNRKLLFVRNRLTLNRLAAAEIPDDRCEPLDERRITYLTGEELEQYATPRFSPDGAKIAVLVSSDGGNAALRILDRDGRRLGEIAKGRAVKGRPAWSPDGRYLYFSSDRTGIFNVYAYDLEANTTWQVTNVLGGALMPDPSPDGRTLAISFYGSRGFDIHALAIDPASWKPVEPDRDPPAPAPAEPKPADVTAGPYSPLATLSPRFWLPWFNYSKESGAVFGAFTFGQDVLRRHQYSAAVLHGPESDHLWYTLDYLYDGLYPTIRVRAADTDVTHGGLLTDPAGEDDYVERERLYDLSMVVPFLKTRRQHAITLGYRWRDLEHLTDLPPRPGYAGPAPAEGVFASGRLSYRFNNAVRRGYSISPERGRSVEVGYERLDEALGGDFEMNRYTADWHEYLNLPWRHHVLQVRAFAGTSSGDRIAQRAFQLGGDFPGDVTLAMDQQLVSLRGYPANAFRGRKVALGSLEYRFPLVNMERGWDSDALYFERLHGAVFFDAGNAWDGTFRQEDLKRSLGIEARFDVVLGYLLQVTVQFGVAAGLDEQGEIRPTLNMVTRF